MLYARRKFKSATMDLAQYVHVPFVLILIFESLFVVDIVTVPEKFPSMYLALITYVDIK